MRRWSLVFLAPLSIACAAVLGLEEAELDESQGGSGGKPATSCNTDTGDACFDDCVSEQCCDEYLNCVATSSCPNYFNCRTACAGDQDCEGECSDMYPDGRARASLLVLCAADCGCESGEGGSGNVVIPEPMGGSSGGGRSGGGGSGPSPSGGQNGGPLSCDPLVDSFSCATANSIRYCDGTRFQTTPCRSYCMNGGFAPGTGDCTAIEGCACGDPIDTDCLDGTAAICACSAQFGESCTPAQQLSLYVYCHQGEPTLAPLVLCAAEAYNAGYSCVEIDELCGISEAESP